MAPFPTGADAHLNQKELLAVAQDGLNAWCLPEVLQEHMTTEGQQQVWLDRLKARARLVVMSGGTEALNQRDTCTPLTALLAIGQGKVGPEWGLAQEGINILLEAGADPLNGHDVLYWTEEGVQIHFLMESMLETEKSEAPIKPKTEKARSTCWWNANTHQDWRLFSMSREHTTGLPRWSTDETGMAIQPHTWFGERPERSK